MSSNVSNTLIWEITRPYSSYLVKRRTAGGIQVSRDPLNVSGKYSYSQSGFINEKALGVIKNSDGNVQIISKVSKNTNKPAKSVAVTTFKKYKSQRAVAAAVSKAAQGYRSDLVHDAVIKASALTRANKTKKVYENKSRK